MKILTPRIHGILDYVTVILFLAAPTLFGLSGIAATISYVLAVVHLLLTLVTAFPLGVADIVPLNLHGWVELVVSVVLIIAPWLLSDTFSSTAQILYTAVGVIIFIVWLLSNYAHRANVAAS